MQTCFPHVAPFQVEGLGWQWMSRTPRPNPPLRTPMLELLCHAHIGVFMEAPFDEQYFGRMALSCHFALDNLCDKEEAHCPEEHTSRRASVGPHPMLFARDTRHDKE